MCCNCNSVSYLISFLCSARVNDLQSELWISPKLIKVFCVPQQQSFIPKAINRLSLGICSCFCFFFIFVSRKRLTSFVLHSLFNRGLYKAELNPRPKERREPRWMGIIIFLYTVSPAAPPLCCCLYCPHFPHLAPLPLGLPPPLPIFLLLAPFCVGCSRAGSHCIVEGEKPSQPHWFPRLQWSIKALFPEEQYFSAKIPLSSAQMALHCLSLTPSQMANLCDLVIISLKQAATFGLEVVLHSEAAAFHSQPLERWEQWHQDISIMQPFHPFFFFPCCCCNYRHLRELNTPPAL